jgi:hypothetical protein
VVSVFWLLLLQLQLLLPNEHQPTIVSLGRSMTGSFTLASSCTLARVAQAYPRAAIAASTMRAPRN